MKTLISGIEFDLEKSIKRLRKDMDDDWFPDFFDNKDIFSNNEFFTKKLKDYVNSTKPYKASPGLHFDIPKPGFTIRYSTETNIIDRLIYQCCVDVIADKFDRIHSPRIYSHRVNHSNDSTNFFKHAVEEWQKFLTDISIELHKEPNEVLLITDLSNYYESISISDLKTTLKLQLTNLSLPVEENSIYLKTIDLLHSLLSTWCEPNTKRGIPQNRDASSFLSNIFLSPVDSEMIKSGFQYFRYLDDIRIVCKDKFEARKALKILVRELRKKGLNVNSKKTQILDLNNPDQKSEAITSLNQNDAKIEQIESLLKSKQSRGVQVAVPMLRKKTISLIEGGATLERHFRFCINRLERLNRIPELKSKLQLEDITDSIIDELLNQPWSTDTFSRYLISVDLKNDQLNKISSIILNDDKNLYEWQEYHLWRVLVSHRHQNANLILKARENLQKKLSDSPVIAGSSLYLCFIGDSNDKKFVVDGFKNFKDHITQRAALIGIKNLDYKTVVQPSVENHILPCLKDCYRTLNEVYKDDHISTPSDLNFKDSYDELPEFIS